MPKHIVKHVIETAVGMPQQFDMVQDSKILRFTFDPTQDKALIILSQHRVIDADEERVTRTFRLGVFEEDYDWDDTLVYIGHCFKNVNGAIYEFILFEIIE